MGKYFPYVVRLAVPMFYVIKAVARRIYESERNTGNTFRYNIHEIRRIEKCGGRIIGDLLLYFLEQIMLHTFVTRLAQLLQRGVYSTVGIQGDVESWVIALT